MNNLDSWHLCDALTVMQAALLIAGADPSSFSWDHFEMSPEGPPDFEAAFAALKHAIVGRRLKAVARHRATWGGHVTEPMTFDNMLREGESVALRDDGIKLIFQHDPDWNETTIMVEDLRNWLRSRGVTSGFFFSEASTAVDYLNPLHHNFAPKLAAAINAWMAISSDPSSLRKRSVKQALEAWLRKNAGQFRLTNRDGRPNETGIKEVAKIANWNLKGGAPRTP